MYEHIIIKEKLSSLYFPDVQIELNFQGRPVCDMGWHFADGFVACRELGFGPAINVTKGI